MRVFSRLPMNPVRFRTEISIGFCCQTAKFLVSGELNRRAILPIAFKREGVAGHVE